MVSMVEPDKVKQKLNQVGCGFCLAKWTQVTIHLGSGINHSCHHVKAHTIPADKVVDNPHLLHNTGFKKNTRKQMLNRERPDECDYCWRVEDNTDSFSDRIWKSRDPWSWQDYHKIAKSTGDEDFYPRYVEVSFSNVCNFMCGYCGPAFSSKWHDEIKKHGPYKFKLSNWQYNLLDEYQKQIPEREDNPYIEAFWKWFPEAVNHMFTFRITGGEPLLSKHTDRVLDYLLENPQPQLEFAINSNACPPGNKWNEFVDKVKKLEENKCIRKFCLFVSAESKGKQAEYNRDGMDWQAFVANVKYYLKNVKGRLCFMSAFNILSFPTFMPFLVFVLSLKKAFEGRIDISIPYVRNPGFLDGQIATKDLIKKYLYPCRDFMKLNKDYFERREVSDFVRIIEDLERRINNPETAGRMQNVNRRMFYEWIEQYDTRRGKNFNSIFPELVQFKEFCKNV